MTPMGISMGARAIRARRSAKVRNTAPARKERKARERSTASKGLTYKEKLELEALPGEIAAAEEELLRIDGELADPTLYAGPEARVRELTARRKELAERIESLYSRWEELEAR